MLWHAQNKRTKIKIGMAVILISWIEEIKVEHILITLLTHWI
jgi:hypothetical protein